MKKMILSSALSLSLLGAAALADDVKIPLGEQAGSQHIATPTTGLTKAQVKSQYGEPQKENPAKGKPPISSWDYGEFTVYFESDHVIHSVIKPKLHKSEEIKIETTDEMPEENLKLK
ncbi:hypothetical protein [Cellvibrio sp.]|uniref:hypothetical protein n=1 Tax=Cellvibrio sp. TaxID=1965322 RepID=UPI00396478FA